MKKLLLAILLSIIPLAQASTTLHDSLWGKWANYAGVHVATFYGIAMQESGMQWHDGTLRPWPWTLNVNFGKGLVKSGPRRYPNQQSAQQALATLMSMGITNIDVGLMQINTSWHGNKVKRVLDLLDPAINIKVAATILRNGKATTIRKTVANYHSAKKYYGDRYVKHVKRYESILYANYR